MELRQEQNGTIYAISKYSEKDALKSAGFRWNNDKRRWQTTKLEVAAKLTQFAADPTLRARLEAENTRLEAARNLSRATTADIDVPAPAGMDYLPYQRAGIAAGSQWDSILIGDEMGLGKTIQAIGIANIDDTINRILVICPASLRLNWQRELQKWLVRPLTVGVAVGNNRPDTDVTIINYDVIGRHLEWIHEQEWDLLVVDECHYLKNPKAKRTIAVVGKPARFKKVGGKWVEVEAEIPPIMARRRAYLTGTPIVNRPKELHPILYAIDPKEWGKFFGFGKRYCNGHQTAYGWDFDGASNLDELQDRLRTTCMIRRMKTDVLKELPAKRRQVIELPANGTAGIIEDEQDIWHRQHDMLDELRAAVELAKASDNQEEYEEAVAALAEGERVAFEAISRARRETSIEKVPYVVEHVRESLDSGSGKIVLFAHHHDVIDAYMEAFGSEAVRLDGRDSMTARDRAVQQFQTDPDITVFVAGLRAAGVGLTLTASSHVVFAELDWVPGNLTQAEDRCHRIGQQNSVMVQHIVLEGSIDANMVYTIVDKQNVIDAALDDQHPDQTDVLASMLTRVEEEQAATKTTSRKQVEQEAEEISPEEIEQILAKLRYLAERCDGALAQDGQGFNSYDSPIGKSLASQNSLSPKQAVLGRKLVNKYRRQVAHME